MEGGEINGAPPGRPSLTGQCICRDWKWHWHYDPSWTGTRNSLCRDNPPASWHALLTWKTNKTGYSGYEVSASW